MQAHPQNLLSTPGSARWWRLAWLAVALATAIPVGWSAYGRLTDVNRKARYAFIVEHRLWEADTGYYGTPATWTRFASNLLTDRQLMVRVRSMYGSEQAEQIMLDHRRDLTIAQAEVIVAALGLWGLPVAGLYGLIYWSDRRRLVVAPAKTPAPSRLSDSRYLP
jgi:hypothetical protein